MRVSFIYYDYSSFVKQDHDILARHFGVGRANYRSPMDIFKVARSIWKSDISFSWFASGHAFAAVVLSKIFRKKSVVIAGGYDVSYMPEMNYGQYCGGRIKRFMTDYVLRNADKVVAVSEFTAKEALDKQPTAKIDIIYNAIDTNKFVPRGEKESLVVTVGTNIPRKRLDVFVETARLLPDIRFAIIGLRDDDIKTLMLGKPHNLELLGRVPDLLTYYQAAKVYCQLSFHEGFGVALAEAMACECVPVVTRRGAMQEVVRDAGVYVPYDDVLETAKGIVTALELDGSIARSRIVQNFSLERRSNALFEVIGGVLNAK